MKKAIGVVTGLLLGGCSPNIPSYVITEPSPGLTYTYQGESPLPWVHVVPSERALAMKNVDFSTIARQIHFDISLPAHLKVLKNVKLVLVDYTILPDETIQKSIEQKGSQGVIYPDSAHGRAPRYYLNMSFYECNKSPPSAPFFEATVHMRKDKIPPQEALRLMARGTIEEIHALSEIALPLPKKKIVVELN